jgi:hypothetical protein
MEWPHCNGGDLSDEGDESTAEELTGKQDLNSGDTQVK